MDGFLKAIAVILTALVLWLCLQKQEKDYALLLSMVVCTMAAALALRSMAPLFALLRQLEELGQLQEGVLEVLLKATGISLVTDLAGMICVDAGNASLEKAVRLLGTVAMLSMAVPVFQTLLSLIQEILGRV